MQYEAFEPDIEVNGQTVFTIVDGFKLIKSIPGRILLNRGIGTKMPDGKVKIEAKGWYSQQAWLDAFKDIAESLGDAILYQIGLKIPENAQFPSWVVDIDSAIRSIDIAYHMNHKKKGAVMFDPQTGKMLEGIGHYGFERIADEKKIISKCNNPYPCGFDRGIVSAMARKFQPSALIKHDDSGPCRTKGDDSCTYVVTW